MAIKNNKYRADFAVGVDSKEASTGFKQILRITSFFVGSMNKLLSKVGAIQREKIRRTPIENILQSDIMSGDIESQSQRLLKDNIKTQKDINKAREALEADYQAKINRKYLRKNKREQYEKEYKENRAELARQEAELALNKNTYNLGKPVISRKVLKENGKIMGEEISSSRYWATGETVEGKDLLMRELNTVKKIKDTRSGTEKVINRIIKQQQVMTQNGVVWKTVLDETNETAKKFSLFDKNGPIATFFKRFKSVAIYRLIRSIIKDITASFTESLSGIAIKNDAFNESFSRITSSMQQLKATLGAAFYQIIIALEPIITSLSGAIVNLANVISYLSAKMNNQGKFVKINTEYLKDYRDTIGGALLEFDEFTTLSSNGLDYNKLFVEQETATADMSKELKDAKETLGNILKIVLTISGIKLVGWLMTGGLQTVNTALALIKGNLGGNFAIIGGIFGFVDGLFSILNWDETTSGLRKVIDVLQTVASVAAVAFGFMSMLSNPFAGTAKIIAGAATILAVGTTVGKTIGTFANGGNFRTGDFFVANENGNTELIASSNSGGGSVMNLDQWAQISEASFFNALARYDAAQNGGSGGLDIDKLGTAIARSSGFKNEINRRNVGLNLV